MKISEYLVEGPAVALYDSMLYAFVAWRPGMGAWAHLLRRGGVEPFPLPRTPKDAVDAMGVLAEAVRP